MKFDLHTIGYLAIIVGILVFVQFLWSLYRKLTVNKWAVTRGVMLECRLELSGGSWDQVVVYRYDVAGKTYTGDTFASPRRAFENKGYSEKLIAPFAVGNTVDVFYNPAKPNEAVLLRRRFVGIEILTVIISFVFIAIGIAIICDV